MCIGFGLQRAAELRGQRMGIPGIKRRQVVPYQPFGGHDPGLEGIGNGKGEQIGAISVGMGAVGIHQQGIPSKGLYQAAADAPSVNKLAISEFGRL